MVRHYGRYNRCGMRSRGVSDGDGRGFLFLMVFGDLLNVLENVTPVVKTFLGGGAIMSIFGGAAIVYWKLIPEPVVANCAAFMKGAGFLDFYIAALISGSILGMERKLLIRAALRYLPCIMGAVGLALIGVALFGKFFSMSAGESIAYIGIPIMGGRHGCRSGSCLKSV